MKKHKMPIGNLFGGFNNTQNNVFIILILLLILLILCKISIIIRLSIILIMLIYLIMMYFKSHRITTQESELNINIDWHTITKKELLFLRAYYQAKLYIYIKSFISTFAILMIANIILYINQSKSLRYILMINVIYFIISLIVVIYLSICKKIDISAECAYIPIKKKYTFEHHFKGHKKINNYAIIITNHKKYIYKIDDIEYNEIMIVNYKGLSCAINSRVFPY